MDNLRLLDYFVAHADDEVVNAGATARELGWPRAAVLHYHTFLIVGRFLESGQGRELRSAARSVAGRGGAGIQEPSSGDARHPEARR
mgnify:CR=1 FL=1